MSNYSKITKHPNKPIWQSAQYMDDYFGPHLYGVKFPDDEVVYPIEMVKDSAIKEFWAEDVLRAFKAWLPKNETRKFASEDEAIIDFTKHIQIQYRNRWKRDMVGGEGALDHYQEKSNV